METNLILNRINELLGTDYDNIDWNKISCLQHLSEDFIREFADKVDWGFVSMYQSLSEDFIREFADKVDWYYISTYQPLSEGFIREFADEVDWNKISKLQHLSEDFIREFELKLDANSINDSWHYKTTEEKKQAVIDSGLYECHEDYFIGYKGIRKDRYSNFNFQYKYEKGGVYSSWCDCSNEDISFGLSVWTERGARGYCDKLIVRVKVKYEDVGRIIRNDGKIRCFKLEILD